MVGASGRRAGVPSSATSKQADAGAASSSPEGCSAEGGEYGAGGAPSSATTNDGAAGLSGPPCPAIAGAAPTIASSPFTPASL